MFKKDYLKNYETKTFDYIVSDAQTSWKQFPIKCFQNYDKIGFN